MSGQVPNRSNNLSREREQKAREASITKGVLRKVTIPRADPKWEPMVIAFYNSLKTSGEADFYQNSDWHYAWIVCEELSAYKKGGTKINRETGEMYAAARSGQMFQSIMSALTSLLVTEGERRRVKIELHSPPDNGPSLAVVAMDGYRKELMEGP